MDKITIICTYQQAEEIREVVGHCIGPMFCFKTQCRDCRFHIPNIEFVIKESED